MRRLAILILMTFAIINSAFPIDTPKQIQEETTVTITAVNRPAAEVFRSLVRQTGKNFVYSSPLLKDIRVTVRARNLPLETVLTRMFEGTDVEFKVKGNDIILKRKISASKKTKLPTLNSQLPSPPLSAPTVDARLLDEVVVTSRLESPAVETAEIGARKITAGEIRRTPAILGEPDVIKTLQTQPGVTGGMEGVAAMIVHGGNPDENLYMLDNISLYQVNHFAGLFSAFNTDILRYIDFFNSSIPAKYDGRLSSFMDVRLKTGETDGHHGSARLGLTAGAFNLSGPIGEKTTYLVGLRRSWYDVLTIPALAIINSSQDEKTRFHYYFMDLNAKVCHRFSNRANLFFGVYFGNDMLKTGSKDDNFDSDEAMNDQSMGYLDDDKYDFHWGNLLAQAGLNYRLTSKTTAEFTVAYTRNFSTLRHNECVKDYGTYTEDHMKSDNNLNDWIFRGDFDWRPNDDSKLRYGLSYVRHSFLPTRSTRVTVTQTARAESRDSTWAYGANEANAYIEDDWTVNDHWRINAGLHASLFNIDHDVKYGLSPRLSLSYRPNEDLALKAAYSRTVQYVHQLAQSYMSLPTDQWIPITGKFKPQNADKVAFGLYFQPSQRPFAFSVEGYYKSMRNLVDYRDEYYLRPPLEMWNARLTSGSGTAKGIDFKVEKLFGKFTGQISYSLAWADRRFREKNGGRTFPARFDNRHTIKAALNWNINDRVTLGAFWVGHTGNRFTLLSQIWQTPEFGSPFEWSEEAPLRTPVNNYRLPFYHRLDLSCTVRNKRGYWTFGLYNAYNHMNVIAVKRGNKEKPVQTPNGTSYESVPVFKKVKFLPIIPSISYTWEF